jgi:hypothetical protein
MERLVGRHLTLDGIEKADEFLVPVALHAAPDDLAFEDIQGGEQGGGTMALVVVGHGGAASFFHRQTGLGAIEGLDLALLVELSTQRFSDARTVAYRAATVPAQAGAVSA